MATEVEEYKLYNGEVTLEYLPNSHTYKVDGDKKMGVTTVTGIINKEALMMYPLGEAITFLKSNLINKTITDDQAVMWSNQELQKIIDGANVAWRAKNLRGTDAGTFGHDWLERYLRSIQGGTPAPDPIQKIDLTTFGEKPDKDSDEYIRATDLNNIVDAIEAFKEWLGEHDVKVLHVENIIYSREYDYAGRLDAILEIDGRAYIIDFKTSNPAREFPDGIYPENFAQLGGYDIAVTEEYPDLNIYGHAIFNLSKKSGRLTIKFSDEREINRAFFKFALGTKRGMQHHTRLLSNKYQENKKR